MRSNYTIFWYLNLLISDFLYFLEFGLPKYYLLLGTYLFLFCFASRFVFPSSKEFLNCINSWCIPKAAPFKRLTLEPPPSETTEPLKFLALVPVIVLEEAIASCSLSQMTVSIRSRFSSCMEW